MKKHIESEENKLIAYYMGYIYYHKGIDMDFSDCGGIYDRYEVFSKVPILSNDYEDYDQYHFKEILNPNSNKENEFSREKICWSSINYENYIYNLQYDKSWDWLMPVCQQIVKNHIRINDSAWPYIEAMTLMRKGAIEFDFKKTLNGVISFIKWWNKQDK